MRKWRIFYLAFVCFALISLALIGTASWLIVRQDRHNAIYWEPQVDEGGVYFMEEVTYHTGFSGIQLTDKGKEKFGENPTYTVVWTKCDDNGGKQIPQDKDEYWGIMAGSYSCTITIKDLATSEMVAIPHEFTINPDTLTVTLEKFGQTSYFEGENSKITYQAKLTSVSGLNLSMEAKDKGAYSLTYDPSTTLAQNKTLKLDEATLFNEAVWGEETAYLYQNNYNIAVDEETQQYKTVTYTVLPTCYVSVNKGTATYYGNLDAALDETYEPNASNTVVVAMQSFSHDGKNYAADAFGNVNVAATDTTAAYTITEKYTHSISTGKKINTNVTLSIPYDSNTSYNSTESTLNREGSGLKVSSTSYKLNPICVNKVTLSGTLTNNGTITVGGVLGRIGQGTSGATSENYSMLAMSQNAVINSTGNLNVFGYVTNTSGGATVNATKGTIIMPFVVYDFHGGSHTVAAYKKGGLAPFSIFDMPNIHARLNLTGGSGGATMIGYTDLYTSALIGDGGQHNLTEITMFGNTNALISMSSGSATFLHTPTQGASFGTSMDNSLVTSASKTEVTLNGNAVSGELEMSINPGIGGTQTVSLTTVQFPISHKFNLSLMGNYDYTFQSRFKFMPGAKLNIGAGARVTVDVDSGLLFYDAFDSTTERYSAYEATTTLKTYYKTDVSVPAVCNVAGTLTVNGYLGGKVNAVGQNAVLDIRNAKALTATEELGNGKTTIDKNDILGSISAMLSGSAYTFDVTFTETQDATGDIWLSASTYEEQPFVKKLYGVDTLDDGKTRVWRTAAILTFVTNGGSLNDQDGNLIKTQTVFVDDNNNMVTAYDAVLKPTHDEYEFDGWYLDDKFQTPLIDGTNLSSYTTVYAKWVAPTFTIEFITDMYQDVATWDPKETIKTEEYRDFWDKCDAVDLDATKAHYLVGWQLLDDEGNVLKECNFADNDTNNDTLKITGNCKLKAVWAEKFEIKVTDSSNVGYQYVVTDRVTGKTSTGTAGTFYAKPLDRLQITVTGKGTLSDESWSKEGGTSVTKDVVLTITKDNCITAGTLITLADGTQVFVETLTGNEMLLVWNMETGRFDKAPIMFIDSDPLAEYKIVHLYFADGTDVKVIYEHGFWDYDLNRYVYLDKDAAQYIGHFFAKQNGDKLEKVQLVDVVIETELTTAWSPVTAGHLCYFVNGMLSMPGGVGGLFNIFEVDAETMAYDLEAMERDIATYGLYTYEELNAICPLSEEMFNAAGGAFLKISIGKGNLTEIELINMITRYSKFFE